MFTLKSLKRALIVGAITLCIPAIANATVVFNLGGCDFSSDPGGTGACGGTGAYLPLNALTMTFAQNGTNTVQLTIDTAGMPDATGKISDVWFNIDGFNFADLAFAHVSGVATKKIIQGGNVFGAVGIFDINFDYKTSGPLGDLFFDKKSVYDISASGLLENNFNALSSGGYPAVMHVNITGNGDSGHYVATPEPATMLLFGTGLVGLFGYGRRKRKK